MLEALDALANRLETLPLAVLQEVVGQVSRFGGQLLEYNRDYLTKQGERPDGQPIQATGYSSAYAAYKRKYGGNTAFVDLKFSGEFIESFVLQYEGGGAFRIVATDKKAGFLAKYGQLLGLREADVLDFITTTLEPAVRRFVRNYMAL